jgi:hypothetical protein
MATDVAAPEPGVTAAGRYAPLHENESAVSKELLPHDVFRIPLNSFEGGQVRYGGIR